MQHYSFKGIYLKSDAVYVTQLALVKIDQVKMINVVSKRVTYLRFTCSIHAPWRRRSGRLVELSILGSKVLPRMSISVTGSFGSNIPCTNNAHEGSLGVDHNGMMILVFLESVSRLIP